MPQFTEDSAWENGYHNSMLPKWKVELWKGRSPGTKGSRPYHKGDNAHVEQKNWSHPRQLLGYERLAFQQLVAPINDLCRNEYSLLKNHFYPTFKLDKKIMVKTRHRRIYGDPTTPYQRVLESVSVPDDIKDRLRTVHETLDPVELQLTVRRKLKNIWAFLKQQGGFCVPFL